VEIDLDDILLHLIGANSIGTTQSCSQMRGPFRSVPQDQSFVDIRFDYHCFLRLSAADPPRIAGPKSALPERVTL
jgi:hypothetical protein